jgi:hypothetical protein
MKFFYHVVVVGVLVTLLFLAGCLNNAPVSPTPIPTPVATSVPVSAVMTPIPTQTSTPFPDALALGQFATFESGNTQGRATVYRYNVLPNYNWTSPSFNSPSEQAAASPPLERQQGFNMETPQEGNVFLFIFVRVENTGNNAVYAPSGKQFVVSSGGKIYNFTSLHGSDVIVDKVSGTQYDYQIGRGGVVGYVQPGVSNAADGYLIYEVPETFSPSSAYVLGKLNFVTQAEWKLG